MEKAGLLSVTPESETEILFKRHWEPTGNLPLDWVLGEGVPFGCFWELYGPSSSGKTTAALSLAAHIQRASDALVIFYETEQGLDAAMLKRTQIDLSKTIRVTEEFTDCVASVTNHIVATCELIAREEDAGNTEDKPIILIWDSISSTPTQLMADALDNKRGKQEVGITAAQLGALANQLNNALPQVKRIIRNRKVLLIGINQIRDVIGGGMYAKREDTIRTPGGNPLKHAVDIRTEIRRLNPHKGFMAGKNVFMKGDTILGTVTQIEATKNKMAPPMKKAAFINWFSTGIDNEYSSIVHAIFDLADYEIISPIVKARCDYMGQSYYPQELARAFRETPDMWAEFAARVREAQIDKDKLITPTSLYGQRPVADEFDEVAGAEEDGDGED